MFWRRRLIIKCVLYPNFCKANLYYISLGQFSACIWTVVL